MSWEVLQGDCRDVLPTLPEKSVNCCVTSPPYFGLRDYGVAGQIGLEPTPDEFVSEMVKVFREVRRVLRDDGTLWLNLGDSYWGGKGMNGSSKARATAEERGYTQSGGTVQMAKRPQDGTHDTIKPKDLIGIPWRVAFALQADGWYLRQDIIWAKPNPMPESVTDRCTKSHEYIFLMAKSERYFCDMDAIKEPAVKGDCNAGARNYVGVSGRERLSQSECDRNDGRNKRSVWTVASSPFSEAHFATFPPKLIEPCILAGCPVGGTVLDPFNGAGTTGLVSVMQGRNYLGIELNPEYIEMTNKRISEAVPLWAPEPVKVERPPELFA